MGEENNKTQNGNQPKRFDQQQYRMLRRCSRKKDMTEWNEWRENNKGADIFLEGAFFSEAYLKGANLLHARLKDASFEKAHLENADLRLSDLENANFFGAHLESANFAVSNMKRVKLSMANLKGAAIWSANLENALLANAHLENINFNHVYLKGACFDESYLQDSDFELAIVDGETSIWKCEVSRHTNFSGVGLDSIRIDPATKQLLEYNIRRMNWEDWYKGKSDKKWMQVVCKLATFPICLFWWMSDYGKSAGRIMFTFFGLAVVFAFVYRLWPDCVVVNGQVGNIQGWWYALYLSIVTPFGVGDIAANPDSRLGQILLVIQVILGYVLLGALVTRFAVLFTAGGSAGKFADEEKKESTDNGNVKIS